MTSANFFDSNTVEIDNILFETLVPNRMLIIPNRDNLKKSAQFGIRITNNSSDPYRFIFFYLLPQFKGKDGQEIKRGYARNVTKTPEESDFILLQHRDITTFFLKAEFYWSNYQLGLRGYDGSGGIWYFDNLRPGMYSVRFTYENHSLTGKIDGGRTPWKFLESLWTGFVSTPYEEFHIVQS